MRLFDQNFEVELEELSLPCNRSKSPGQRVQGKIMGDRYRKQHGHQRDKGSRQQVLLMLKGNKQSTSSASHLAML